MKWRGNALLELVAPTRSQFIQQLDLVQSFGDLRLERLNEIVSQVVPQTAYWSSIAGVGPDSHRYTWELLGVGLRCAMMVVMRFKHLLECPRPGEYSSLIQPVVLTPGYTAYPSGHATEGYFAATMLSDLALGAAAASPAASGGLAKWTNDSGSGPALLGGMHDGLRSQLNRLAYRVAENRVVAGLHFPIDSMAGQALGTNLARLFRARATDGQARDGGTFDFNVSADLTSRQPVLDDAIPSQGHDVVKVGTGAILAQLWESARDEWR